MCSHQSISARWAIVPLETIRVCGASSNRHLPDLLSKRLQALLFWLWVIRQGISPMLLTGELLVRLSMGVRCFKLALILGMDLTLHPVAFLVVMLVLGRPLDIKLAIRFVQFLVQKNSPRILFATTAV